MRTCRKFELVKCRVCYSTTVVMGSTLVDRPISA